MLATEDMWMGDRSQPANFDELHSYPGLADKRTPASLQQQLRSEISLSLGVLPQALLELSPFLVPAVPYICVRLGHSKLTRVFRETAGAVSPGD